MSHAPGWKTSEFWITAIIAVCSLLTASGVFHSGTAAAGITQSVAQVQTTPDQSPVVQIAALVAAALAGVGYAGSRAMTKTAAHQADATTAAAAIAATPTATPTPPPAADPAIPQPPPASVG